MIILSYDISNGGHTEIKQWLKIEHQYRDTHPNTALKPQKPGTTKTRFREVAEALIEEGFQIREPSESPFPGDFPNTTLKHSSKTKEQAIIDLYDAVQVFNAGDPPKPAELTAIVSIDLTNGQMISWGKN